MLADGLHEDVESITAGGGARVEPDADLQGRAAADLEDLLAVGDTRDQDARGSS
jgi:hypothetical protein